MSDTLFCCSKALEEGERLGLLEPQYTWIGVHLATTVYVNHKNRMGGSKDDLLAKLEAEMIYLETTDEVVSDSALMFGNSILDQSDLMDKIKPAVGEFHLSDSVDWKEFTTAYDSAWLIAAAFSHHLATSEILQSSSSAAGDDKEPCDPCHVANEDAAEQLGVLQWLSAIPSVSFTGLSGAVSVKSNNSTSFELADHDANDFFVKTLSAAGGKQVINRLPAITPIFSPAYRYCTYPFLCMPFSLGYTLQCRPHVN